MKWTNLIDRLELLIVTAASKIVPILTPMIPGYVGYIHITDMMGFDPFFGWVYAGVVEGLGYAAIYKGVQFWEHNKKYAKGSPNRAPLGTTIVVYLLYLAVTLAVNVLLSWVDGLVWYKLVTLALISILSIPAGLLMSVSAIHTERENERTQANAERRAERLAERQTNEQPNEQQQPERTNAERRTPNRTNRPNERTQTRTIPQPSNERRTPNAERPMGFLPNDPNEQKMIEDMEPGERVRWYIERVQKAENRTPGQSEIARAVGVSKSTADSILKK